MFLYCEEGAGWGDRVLIYIRKYCRGKSWMAEISAAGVQIQRELISNLMRKNWEKWKCSRWQKLQLSKKKGECHPFL
jgi:hypothetical protein